MTCQIEQIADCGDISSTKRALFMVDTEDEFWLSKCNVALSSCGSLLAISHRTRLCLLANQWLSSTNSNAYLISWSGTLSSEITALLVLAICPSNSSQNVPDWFCIIVGFQNGNVEFYSNTGHLLLSEKLDDKPVLKLTCHMGTYGTLQDDVHVFFHHGQCILTGSALFQTLRNIKANVAKVKAGVQIEYTVDYKDINKKKWLFSEQENINDAVAVGLQLKTSYDYLLAASVYGGYDVWYHAVPPVNSLILGVGVKPYIGFHYANEGGSAPPIQDVARAVAYKIKSALPGWLGGSQSENISISTEPLIKSEMLMMRDGLYDSKRHGTSVTLSPDRLLAVVIDNLGRVAIIDTKKGHLIRLFKGYRDAQCAFMQAIALFHLGFDGLVETVLVAVQEPHILLVPMMEISIQRLKRSLQQSQHKSEWMVTVPPHLYSRIENTELDNSIPAHPSLSSTSSVLRKLLYQVDKKHVTKDHRQTIKLIIPVIESCDILTKCQL